MFFFHFNSVHSTINTNRSS